MSLNGSWCEIHNLVITHTAGERVSAGNHSWPEDINTEQGLAIIGEGVKVINNIIHDVYGSGILGSGSNGKGAEVYGNIIFNTGWIGSENGHGHGMYLQSNEGSKKAVNNIVFNSYGHGIQFYTTGAQSLDGMCIDKNIVFNAGVPADENSLGSMRNMMLGGNANIDNLVVRNNFTYHAQNSSGTGLQVGYNNVSNSCTINGNYIAGGNKVFVIYRFNSASILNNTIIGKNEDLLASLYLHDGASLNNYTWNHNSYYADNEKFFDANNNRTLDFSGWKTSLKIDQNSTIASTANLHNHVAILPNEYDTKRAHIVIYNWENHDQVSVDPGSILETADAYTIYDVENIFTPLLSGVYTSTAITIPMDSQTVIQPAGTGIYPLTHTTKEFGVFLLVSDS